MRLADFSDLAQQCREDGYGFAEFQRHDLVVNLRWPADVLEQWVTISAGNGAFQRDYEQVDLTLVWWQVEALPVDDFMVMPTGPSDLGGIEYFAADPEHSVGVRDQGQHLGMELAWETHGTWKRWPIVLDRRLLTRPRRASSSSRGETGSASCAAGNGKESTSLTST